MKVLLVPVGSRGDVQPQLVLGAELQRRGHSVQVAAPPNFRASVQALGFPFVPIGADVNTVLLQNRELAEQHPLVALPRQIALLRAHTERQVRDLLGSELRADIVVSAGLSFAGKILADKLGVPHVFLCYTLGGMRSAAHPPAALPIFGLPKLGNRALWASVTKMFDLTLGRTLNRLRREFELPPDPSPWRSIHATQALLAQDEIIGKLPGDTPGQALQVAAIVSRLKDATPLSDALERFLRGAGDGSNAASPIVYLGFGSMPSVDRGRIVKIATELFEEHGARVILFSAHAEEAGIELPAGVFSTEDADHRLLFPRVDLIVHHGGAGTTAAALRAGVAQLIVPHIVDQFFHARRVAELGLGPKPVSKTELSATLIAAALKNRFKYWDKAQSTKARVELDGGTNAAADHLERLLS